MTASLPAGDGGTVLWDGTLALTLVGTPRNLAAALAALSCRRFFASPGLAPLPLLMLLLLLSSEEDDSAASHPDPELLLDCRPAAVDELTDELSSSSSSSPSPSPGQESYAALPEEPPLPLHPPPPPPEDMGELNTTMAGGALSCLRSMSIRVVWAEGHTSGGGRCRAAPAVSLEVSRLPPLARARAGDSAASVSSSAAAGGGGVWGDPEEEEEDPEFARRECCC